MSPTHKPDGTPSPSTGPAGTTTTPENASSPPQPSPARREEVELQEVLSVGGYKGSCAVQVEFNQGEIQLHRSLLQQIHVFLGRNARPALAEGMSGAWKDHGLATQFPPERDAGNCYKPVPVSWDGGNGKAEEVYQIL